MRRSGPPPHKRRKRNESNSSNRSQQRAREPRRSANDQSLKEELSSPSTSPSSENVTTASSASGSQHRPDIAGYYWDDVLNRYFKIPRPGSTGPEVAAYQEVLRRRQAAEQEKLKQLSNELLQQQQEQILKKHSSYPQIFKRFSENAFLRVSGRQYGLTWSEEEKIAWGLRTRGFDFVAGCVYIISLGNCRDVKYDSKTGAWFAGSDDGVYLHSILEESVDANGRPNYTLNANIAGWEDRGPITSVHCVPALKGTYTVTHFGTHGRAGTLNFVTIQEDSEDSDADVREFCTLRSGSMYSHAWSINGSLAIGKEKGALLYYIVDDSAKHTTLYSGKSDVLCLEFNSMGNILYMGTRSGTVCRIDMRMNNNKLNKRTFGLLEHPHKLVNDMKLLNDENYILTNTMSGEVHLWDFRMERKIYDYMYSSQTRFSYKMALDPRQHFVFCGDETKSLNIIRIKDGKLIHRIEDEFRDPVMALALTDEWCIHKGKKGYGLGMFIQSTTDVSFYEL